jgi:hypothetical protein
MGEPGLVLAWPAEAGGASCCWERLGTLRNGEAGMARVEQGLVG